MPSSFTVIVSWLEQTSVPRTSHVKPCWNFRPGQTRGSVFTQTSPLLSSNWISWSLTIVCFLISVGLMQLFSMLAWSLALRARCRRKEWPQAKWSRRQPVSPSSWALLALRCLRVSHGSPRLSFHAARRDCPVHAVQARLSSPASLSSFAGTSAPPDHVRDRWPCHRLAQLLASARAGQQVGAGRPVGLVGGKPRVGCPASGMAASAAPGPSTSAIASARLMATTARAKGPAAHRRALTISAQLLRPVSRRWAWADCSAASSS